MVQSLVDLIRPLQFRGKFRVVHRLAPQRGSRVAWIFGVRMELDLADWIQRNIYLGTYERRETRIFRKLLKAGDVVVDVGANIGYFTALAASLVRPRGKVIAIEPSPYASAKLQKMLSANALGACEALNVGLADAPGELPIYLGAGSDNHSPTMVSHGAPELARVAVRTLDSVLNERAIERVDLLKIDVEGYEPSVLAGAAESLKLGRVHNILIEVNKHWLARVGSTPAAVMQTLERHGFREHPLSPARNGQGLDNVLMTLA